MIDALSVFIVLATAAAAAFLIARQRRKLEDGKKYPPSLPSLPLVGSLPFLRGGMEILPDYFIDTSKRLGPVFSYYAAHDLVVVLNGKEALYEALIKRAEVFGDRADCWTEVNRHNKELRGIVFAHYDENFRKYHKLSLSIMREFGFGVSHESDVLVWNQVEPFSDILRSHNNRPFNPKELLVHATSKVVMNFLFGGGLQPVDEFIRKLTHNCNIIVCNIDPSLDLAPFLRFLPYYGKKIAALDKAQAELMEGIEEALRYIKSGKAEDNSFAKRFMEIQGANYSHQDLLYILRDLSLGSTDTTAVTLYWAFVEMARNPAIKARVQEEIDENLPTHRLPSHDDKRCVPYTEAVILESSRFHILAPFGVIHSTLRDSEVCGYFIPKGCKIVPNLWSVHKDAKIWTDPQNFRPERFLDENMKIIGKENVVSFGLGKRQCIGETLARHEVFVFFTSIMQHFDILPPEGVDMTHVEVVCGVNVEPKDAELRFIPRK